MARRVEPSEKVKSYMESNADEIQTKKSESSGSSGGATDLTPVVAPMTQNSAKLEDIKAQNEAQSALLSDVITALTPLATTSSDDQTRDKLDENSAVLRAILHFLDGISDKLTYPDAQNNTRVSIQAGTLPTVTTVGTVTSVTAVAAVNNFGVHSAEFVSRQMINLPAGQLYTGITIS